MEKQKRFGIPMLRGFCQFSWIKITCLEPKSWYKEWNLSFITLFECFWHALFGRWMCIHTSVSSAISPISPSYGCLIWPTVLQWVKLRKNCCERQGYERFRCMKKYMLLKKAKGWKNILFSCFNGQIAQHKI